MTPTEKQELDEIRESETIETAIALFAKEVVK